MKAAVVWGNLYGGFSVQRYVMKRDAPGRDAKTP